MSIVRVHSGACLYSISGLIVVAGFKAMGEIARTEGRGYFELARLKGGSWTPGRNAALFNYV